MRYVIQVIGAILLYQSCFSQHLDLSIAERYFEITDSLKKDISLSNESWNSFIEMDGLRDYISRQHLETEMDDYKKNLEFVYMPQHDSLLTQLLKEPVKNDKAYFFYQQREMEIELKNFIRKIKFRPDIYLNSVYDQAYSLLPYRMRRTSMRTNISFVPLFKEGVGNGFDILLSLYASYYLDNINSGASAAHRLHHMLRRNKRLSSPRDSSLYDVLTSVIEEGMADLIDKPIPDSVECPDYLRVGDSILKMSSNGVAILDSMIQQHIDGKRPFDTVNMYSNIQVKGHVPGYSMALVIEKNGLIREMIKYANDPIRFLLLYNKAAALDEEKPPLFSDKTIAYIKKLQKKQRKR